MSTSDKNTIQSVIKTLADSLAALSGKDSNQITVEKLLKESAETLELLKNRISGDANDPSQADEIQAVSSELLLQDIPSLLIGNMAKLDFESKKATVTLLCAVLRQQVGDRHLGVEYFANNPSLLEKMVAGYNNSEEAIHCGTILRACSRHEALAAILLRSEKFFDFFIFVGSPNFDVASDAFATFKETITKHKKISAEFLENNYNKFFDFYNGLLHSENYVTLRQALKLLGELLLERSNFNIMIKYVSQQDNFKLNLHLLRDKGRSIQFEAFHVFKIFVANPNKSEPILKICIEKKAKLIKFLHNFYTDRADEPFYDEKAYLLKILEQME